jgi:hypothetical protein
MRVIIYDMRDAKEPGDRQIVLRMIGFSGCLILQSPIYANEDLARHLGEILAETFNTELEWIGPTPMSAMEAFSYEAEQTKAAMSIGLKQLDLFG